MTHHTALSQGEKRLGRINLDLITQTVTADYEHTRPLLPLEAHELFITYFPNRFPFADDSLKLHIGAADPLVYEQLDIGARMGWTDAKNHVDPVARRFLVGTSIHLAYRAGYIAFLGFRSGL